LEYKKVRSLIVVWSITRVGIVEIRELGVEIGVSNWSTISNGLITNNSIGWVANSESSMTQDSHGNSQHNINHIITRSSSVRISSSITTNNSESVLASSCSWGNLGVKSEKINKF